MDDGDDEFGNWNSEIGRYQLDKAHYDGCPIDSAEIFIKKYYLPLSEKHFYRGRLNPDLLRGYDEDSILYIAASDRNFLVDDTAPENLPSNKLDELPILGYRTCSAGNGYAQTNQQAGRCGIATILSYLCYQDREIEPSIKGPGIGYDFDTHEINVSEETLEKFKKQAEKGCKRIMKVVTFADPSAGARAYIYAAIDAEYRVLMSYHRKIGEVDIEKISIKNLNELSKQFQKQKPVVRNGKLVDPVLDPLITKIGNIWFFCKKK